MTGRNLDICTSLFSLGTEHLWESGLQLLWKQTEMEGAPLAPEQAPHRPKTAPAFYGSCTTLFPIRKIPMTVNVKFSLQRQKRAVAARTALGSWGYHVCLELALC